MWRQPYWKILPFTQDELKLDQYLKCGYCKRINLVKKESLKNCWTVCPHCNEANKTEEMARKTRQDFM
ncbi:MAG: hypothetical protein HUU50_21855, partial [Candidatus Brocadiae bacterium]|nr:hypothetical protein [Candidatus Brocadiia bacterium]